MTDTITSNSGVLYDVVEITKGIYYGQCVLQKSSAQIVEINGNKYITENKPFQKSSQSSGECEHSFDSSLLSNPPIAVCSKCGFQKKESATCKSCLGKKKLSVYTNQVVSPDFVGDKPYHTGEDDIQYVNCSRCKGDGLEPKVESEKNDFGKELEKFMKYEGYTDFNIEQMKDFLSSNGYL